MNTLPKLFTAVLIGAAFGLSGCMDGLASQKKTVPADSHGHEQAGHEAAFDIDDVPSLNLPPEQRDPDKLWCRGHDRYEDECYICHPDLIPTRAIAGEAEEPDHDQEGRDGHDGESHSSHAVRNGVLWCGEHDVAETDCGICQPQRLAELQTGGGMKVRLPSAGSLEKAGVIVGTPEQGGAAAQQRVLGEVSYNRNQLAAVTPLGGGVVTEVFADVGDTVEQGQLLAAINAPAIAEAKSAYLKVIAMADLARQVHAREKDLHTRGISARQELEEAQATLSENQSEMEHARQHLMNLGLTEAEVDAVRDTRSTSSALQVRAPFTGTVIEREAVPGTAVETGMALFHVADLSSMWMLVSIPESQLALAREQMPITAEFDAYPGREFDGRLTWIAPGVDTQTRMVEARVLLPNPGGLLKDGMYGTATLTGADMATGVTVPAGAVQEVDGRPIVFARLDDDLYETRLVDLGPANDGAVTVLSGLSAGETIALDGSYILKSEFLKARLGAGCADH